MFVYVSHKIKFTINPLIIRTTITKKYYKKILVHIILLINVQCEMCIPFLNYENLLNKMNSVSLEQIFHFQYNKIY
jgi:hypothetical protein